MEKALDAIIAINSNISVARFVVNTLRENTYIIYNNVREGIVIDCGVRREEEKERLSTFVEQNDLQLKAHLLTHAHFDHIWGAQWLFDTYNLTPTMLRDEFPNYPLAESVLQRKLHRPDLSLPLPQDPILVDEGYKSTISNLTLEYIFTPGHSRGGACLYDRENKLLFSGDCLFKGYIGLPKDPGLSPELMPQILKQKIYSLPRPLVVLPGHGMEFEL